MSTLVRAAVPSIFALLSLLACSSDGSGSDTGEIKQKDPCAGRALPICPEACPTDYTELCGEPCFSEGAECGSPIGDGMKCEQGTWECSVHSPLGPGCNQICKLDPEDACAKVALPLCPPACDDGFASVGAPCENEGESCGNSIGDGCTCQDGSWSCTPHAPLGPGCNLVCRELPGGDPCADADLPDCAEPCDGGFEVAGAPCDDAGASCAISNVGDECSCDGEQWVCSPHAPLGPGCNLVCK